ncbi:MAG: cyclodeaminase/cyclohydrolase family protein [Peptococcaceae bacterium]|nr:cyclodeaminase/cyclohydrolase family protein [Peptococcaceae bacterium]
MKMLEKSAVDFLSELSSSAPVPGGGGASAAVGAFAAALGMMVTNLTIGKKKYADYEDDVKAVREHLESLRDQLIDLVDADAVAFAPLSKAYSIPKDNPERDTIMENALYEASVVPLRIMETVLAAAKALDVLVEKGSKLAISDVGVGILFAQAAIEGASLNVFINTKSMQNRDRAAELDAKANAIIAEGAALKERIYSGVLAAMK